MVGANPPVAELPLDWKLADNTHPLGENEIHLWFLDATGLNSAWGDDGILDFLNPREVGRAQAIQAKDKRELYIAGRAGLRILLGQYASTAPLDLDFVYGERGKPSMPDRGPGAGIEFNYSVSSGCAIYAFARGIALGIDLEIFPRDIETELFAKRILSPGERHVWAQFGGAQKNAAMLACWTRKEAYGKLLGVGIRYNMNQAELFVETRSPHWCAQVTGLFGGSTADHSNEVRGAQLSLPVAGAATLMYDRNKDYNPASGSHSGPPRLMPFTYAIQRKD